MVARAEKSEKRARGGAHSTGETELRLGSLEHRHAFLHNFFIGRVAVARVEQVGGAKILHVVDRLCERLRHGRTRLSISRSAVHCDGAASELFFAGGHGLADRLTRAWRIQIGLADNNVLSDGNTRDVARSDT